MTTWTTADYRRGLPKADEIAQRPPHPTLLKYAGEYMTRPSVYRLELKASQMATTLKTLADGNWHELCRADGPDSALVKHRLVEVEKLGINLNCRITEAGLKIHHEIEGTPLIQPQPKAPAKPKRKARSKRRAEQLEDAKAADVFYHEFNLLMCLG